MKIEIDVDEKFPDGTAKTFKIIKSVGDLGSVICNLTFSELVKKMKELYGENPVEIRPDSPPRLADFRIYVNNNNCGWIRKSKEDYFVKFNGTKWENTLIEEFILDKWIPSEMGYESGVDLSYFYKVELVSNVSKSGIIVRGKS